MFNLGKNIRTSEEGKQKNPIRLAPNWTQTQNHLIRKRTLNHLAKWLNLAKWLSVGL